MKAILVGSKHGREKMPDTFDILIETLEAREIEILGPYTQEYSEVLTKEEMSRKNEKEIHSLFMYKIIDQADFMIIETTFDGFALGHESTVALEKYKPVLAISKEKKDFSYIQDEKFVYKSYNSHTELPSLIDDFLEYFEKNYRTFRVNVLLHQRHINYLKWIYYEKNINRSSFIRHLLDESMQEESEYLK